MVKIIIFLVGLISAAASLAAEAGLTPTAEVTPIAIAVSPSASAAASPAATPEPSAAFEATVVLKDGQRAVGKIEKYDAFFFDFLRREGAKALSIPWREVAELTPTDFSGDAVIIKQYLTAEKIEVRTKLLSKDPGKALSKAFWPGFILHGAGHREAGDNDTFLSLAGAELFGALIGAFGVAELAGPEVKGETKGTAQALAISGAGIFLISWVWDIVGAPGAARDFNARHDLGLAPLPQGGAVLAWRTSF